MYIDVHKLLSQFLKEHNIFIDEQEIDYVDFEEKVIKIYLKNRTCCKIIYKDDGSIEYRRSLVPEFDC